MALQNIGASNRGDAFYRYKMPKMVTKTEGRGNGIKTNIVNNVEIAKALGRPPSYTTKYFGCQLGAQSKFDEKTGTSLVNGAHATAKLSDLLENFIKKYVQCYGCGNPETEVIITKTQMVNLQCAACGFISEVDMRDKLTTFILKNPPEQKKGSKDKKAMRRAEKERLEEGEAADEEQRRLKKGSKKKASTTANPKDASSKISKKTSKKSSDEDHSPARSLADENEQVDDDDGDVQWQTDTSHEAAERRMKEQLSAVTAEMVMLSTEEEKKKPERKGNGHQNRNGEIPKPQEKLAQEIKEHLKKGSPVSHLKPFLASLSAPPQEVMDALFVALFEGVGKGFAKEVSKKKNYLAASTQGEGSQMLLLHAIESFCGKASPEAAKEVALVIKALYDDDVLEEEFVLVWYKKGPTGDNENSEVWKNVKLFVEWLQNAESESE